LTPAPVDAPSHQEDDRQHGYDQHHSGLRYAETVLTEPAVSDMPISYDFRSPSDGAGEGTVDDRAVRLLISEPLALERC
jgi:hypothetical protein